MSEGKASITLTQDSLTVFGLQGLKTLLNLVTALSTWQGPKKISGRATLVSKSPAPFGYTMGRLARVDRRPLEAFPRGAVLKGERTRASRSTSSTLFTATNLSLRFT